MNTSLLIQDYAARVQRGEIPFDGIRKELEARGFGEDDIRLIVREVDLRVQQQMVSGANKDRTRQLVLAGYALTTIGAVITLGSWSGLFNSGNTLLIVVAYGPLLGGLSLIFAGMRARNRSRSR